LVPSVARERNVGLLSGTGRHGEVMNSAKRSTGEKRILVVEDEPMIRMLLDGMLTDLGYTMVAEAGAIEEALNLAKQVEFDAAILDVNLNGQPITPVVEILVQRGLPFVFATGYGQRGVPEAYRTNLTLQKPFQIEALEQALKAIVP
jgi:CheY-like chemotaxis protein